MGTVRLTFNRAVADDANTSNTANYAITGGITVSAVTRRSGRIVDLTTNEMTGGAPYTVTVSNLFDTNGWPIATTKTSANFLGYEPPTLQVLSAAVINATTIDVEFNQEVEQTTAETAGNYAITGDDTPTVSAASKTAATTVRLTIPFAISGSYTVTASNVTNLAAEVVNPLHDDASFSFDAVIFYGGGATNHTWAWSAADWVDRLPANHPTAQFYGYGVYDSIRKVIVFFGGQLGGTHYDETWEYDGVNWEQKSPVHVPPNRRLFSMAFDSNRGVVVMFGGDNNPGGPINDTWEYDGTDWEQKVTAHSPSIRMLSGMAFDSVRNKVVLYGGTTGAAWYSDTWEYNGTDWTDRSIATPGNIAGQGMGFDISRGVTVMFGGYNPGYLDTTWEFDGTLWTQKASGAVTKPSARNRMGFAYDPVSASMFLFGGQNGAPIQDSWRWNGTVWTQLAPGSSPAASDGPMLATFIN